jgi:hypothetical protein
LASQYQRDVSLSAVYEPIAFDGFWACCCGSLNRDDDEYCHTCKLEKEKQFLALDRDTLVANKTAYDEEIARKKVEAEALRVERERKEELARQEAERIRKRNLKIKLLTFGPLALCAALTVLWIFVLTPMLQYNKAQEQFDQGNFDEAISAFAEL